MIVRFQTVEGAQTTRVFVDEAIDEGQVVKHLGRSGVAAAAVEAYSDLKIMKRATVAFTARVYPGVPLGLIGPLYGTFVRSVGYVDLYELDWMGDTQLGVIEGWDMREPANPRFIVSFGDPSSSAVDQEARDRADDAFDLAASALGQFPPTAGEIYYTGPSNSRLAAGEVRPLAWQGAPSRGLNPDAGDNTLLRPVQGLGVYLVAIDVQTFNSGSPLDISVSDSTDTVAFLGLVRYRPLQGQLVILVRFSSVDQRIRIRLRNTGATESPTIDTATRLAATRIAL